MGKAVLISIQPQWCEKIATREKSLEVRKSKPNIQPPFKCYIYQTRRKWLYKILEKLSLFAWARSVIEGQRKVIGEFVCDSIFEIEVNNEVHTELPGWPTESWLEWNDAPDGYETAEAIEKGTCLSIGEISLYIGAGCGCYCWHISALVIYDRPRELAEFKGLRGTKFGFEPVALSRPPQSWYYVEDK